jgi:hypothetical protein
VTTGHISDDRLVAIAENQDAVLREGAVVEVECLDTHSGQNE